MSTVFVMIMMLSLFTSLLLFNYGFKFLVAKLEDKVDISVYFKENSQEDDILKVKAEIEKMPEIKEIDYVSREKALQNFIALNQHNPSIMESLEEVGNNPLLPSLNIRVYEAAQYAQVSGVLQGTSFGKIIDKVDYYERKPFIDRVFGIGSGIKSWGMFFTLALAVLSSSLVFNQIRLSIYGSKRELEVMRLVGASNWFVRGPFLLQGVLIGGFAGIITFLLFLPFCAILSSRLDLLLPGLNIFGYLIDNFAVILLAQLAVGIGLGVFFSVIATKKYLEI